MKKNNLNILLGIIAVLVIGVLAYVIASHNAPKKPQSNILVYGNHSFVQGDDGNWYTQMTIRKTPYTLSFHYNPFEVENVTVDSLYTPEKIKTFRQFHPNSTIYITMDPTQSSRLVIASVEIAKILGKAYNIYNYDVHSAITEPSDANTEIPVITCANATGSTMVIWITVDNSNQISSSSNCIIIEATDANETIRVADALAFRLLNIMQ
jgi:hypothetical protein